MDLAKSSNVRWTEEHGEIMTHWQSGQLHRDDGPAVEWPDGSNFWFVEGLRHREDGPAVQYANGTEEWYIRDRKIIDPLIIAAMKFRYKD